MSESSADLILDSRRVPAAISTHIRIWRRDSNTQLALLDRIAGTVGEAQLFGLCMRELREAEAQLALLEALGDEDARGELQALADQVGSMW